MLEKKSEDYINLFKNTFKKFPDEQKFSRLFVWKLKPFFQRNFLYKFYKHFQMKSKQLCDVFSMYGLRMEISWLHML